MLQYAQKWDKALQYRTNIGCSPRMESAEDGHNQAFMVSCACKTFYSRVVVYYRIADPGESDPMIRSELIQKIADENPHLYQRDVERIVNTIFEEITEAMAEGHRVELRGFGAFSVKKRDARVGRNPRTGDAVQVEEKHVPFFKTGKLLRDRLNGN